MNEMLEFSKNIQHYKQQLDTKEKSASNPFFKFI